MKKIVTIKIMLLATVLAFGQNKPIMENHPNAMEPMTTTPIGGIILPILFISFLVFMLLTLIKYFLEFRLKSKLIDKGMLEQLSVYLSNKNLEEKQNEAIKWAILFCGIGAGLTATYFTAPIHIHSIAIMAFCLGLSYLAYFFYLRK